jgi:uncharacterized protein YdcH (DUF465 family)
MELTNQLKAKEADFNNILQEHHSLQKDYQQISIKKFKKASGYAEDQV